MERIIDHQDGQVNYRKAGNGSRIYLTFHGYGQNCGSFEKLTKINGQEAVFYHFDLFYHGNSNWSSRKMPISKKYWKDLIEKFIKQENINEFSLIGFSIGAKFVLATLEAYPDKVNEVILIAPDGIQTNIWYKLATFPIFLRLYFRHLILKPKSFSKMITLIRELKIVDRSLVQLAVNQMKSRSSRWKLYHTWVNFRLLKFSLNKIVKLVEQHDLRFVLIIGKKDKLVPPKLFIKLEKKLPTLEHVELNVGHLQLLPEAMRYLEQAKVSP